MLQQHDFRGISFYFIPKIWELVQHSHKSRNSAEIPTLSIVKLFFFGTVQFSNSSNISEEGSVLIETISLFCTGIQLIVIQEGFRNGSHDI